MKLYKINAIIDKLRPNSYTWYVEQRKICRTPAATAKNIMCEGKGKLKYMTHEMNSQPLRLPGTCSASAWPSGNSDVVPA